MIRQPRLVAVAILLCSLATARADTPTTQPTFEELPAMDLAGIATRATPGSDVFSKLWDSFPADVENQPGVSTSPYSFGVSLVLPSTKDRHEFTYVAAGQITDATKVPLHLIRLSTPAGTYAVFKLHHSLPEGLPEISPMFDFIYSQWLPNADYVLVAPLNIERYAVKDNTITILIPVKKK